MKEYPRCPFIVICSVTARNGEAFSWTCLRLKRTVGRAHCEQCGRAIERMMNVQCR